MRLTVEMLRHTYEMLRAMQPFHRWSLPVAHKIKFSVTRHGEEFGAYIGPSPHEIRVSRVMVKSAYMLIETMAHEMVHLRQCVSGSKTGGGDCHEGPEFEALADTVCKHTKLKREDF